MHKTVKFYIVPETTIVLSYKEEGVAPGQLQIKYCRGVHLVIKSTYEERVPSISSKKKMNKRMINKMMMIECHPLHL